MHYLCHTDTGLSGVIEAKSENEAPDAFVGYIKKSMNMSNDAVGEVIDIEEVEVDGDFDVSAALDYPEYFVG